jgi:hypothetical protein
MISKKLSSKNSIKSKNFNNKTKKNTKIELNLSNIKDIYNDIIKNCSDENINIIIEFLLNYYLLLKGLRHIFQIYIKSKKPHNILNKLILEKFNINLYKAQNKHIRLIIYNPNKFNINELDKTFMEKYALQLGKFYVCASNDFSNCNGRTTILARKLKPLLCKNNKKVYIRIELYAQMCNYSDIANKKNIDKIFKIFKPIQKTLKEFDNNLIIENDFIYY